MVVLGAGTLGLLTIAALRHLTPAGMIITAARYPHQMQLARALGADQVCEPGACPRVVRRLTSSLAYRDQLTGGCDVVLDCVGDSDSLAQSLAIVRPQGTVVVVGMPGQVKLELTTLVAPRDPGRRRLRLRARRRRPRRRRAPADVRAGLRPGRSRPTSAASSPRCTPCTTTRTPSPTPPRPAAEAPSRWPSTSARRRSGTADAQTRLRPRGRPLDSPAAVLAGRRLQPRAPPRRPDAGGLRPRATRPGEGRRRRHSPRPVEPGRVGPAPRPVVPGHEADHRLRRRQPAACRRCAVRTCASG